MPELPEVETLRAGLYTRIVGKQISDLIVLNEKSFLIKKSETKNIIGSKIVDIKRRAKLLIIQLDNKYNLLIHLKMTGQLVYDGKNRFGAGHPNDSLVNQLPDKSTRVEILFDDNTKLYFNDQRKFGWIKLVSEKDLDNVKFLQKLGPEPLEKEFTFEVFKKRLFKHPNANIKAVLLNQEVLAGIGNIYADESLWGAKIHPSCKVTNISNVKLKNLYNEIIYILNLSIEKGGSSNRNYVNADGKKGSFTDFARVFRRDKLACPRCESIIAKIRVAGRGTHVCPKCQKLS